MKHDLAAGGHELTPTEAQFLTRLREQPELRARFQSILELTRHADGPLLTADAVEERLLQELRQLDHTSMNQWATQAEQRVSAELKGQDSTVRSRKKRRCRGGVSSGWGACRIASGATSTSATCGPCPGAWVCGGWTGC